MGKTLFTLELPEPEVRKTQAPPLKKHKDKKLYSRKMKHRKSSVPAGDFFIGWRQKRSPAKKLLCLTPFCN